MHTVKEALSFHFYAQRIPVTFLQELADPAGGRGNDFFPCGNCSDVNAGIFVWKTRTEPRSPIILEPYSTNSLFQSVRREIYDRPWLEPVRRVLAALVAVDFS